MTDLALVQTIMGLLGFEQAGEAQTYATILTIVLAVLAILKIILKIINMIVKAVMVVVVIAIAWFAIQIYPEIQNKIENNPITQELEHESETKLHSEEH